MSRLSEIFNSQKKCFIPFVVAGYPDLETSKRTILALAEAGAGIVEIGIPFSDPVADGPVIQKASFAALEKGYSMDDYLQMTGEIREKSDVGLVMMSYCNPIYHYGIGRFEQAALRAGLDGVLLSDISIEEYLHGDQFEELAPIFLIAPTSSSTRLELIAKHGKGFLYLISRTGVTGRETDFNAGMSRLVSQVRRLTELPLAVGFGVRTKADIKSVFAHADAAVVGSAIVNFMMENQKADDLPELTAQFVKEQIFSRDLLG